MAYSFSPKVVTDGLVLYLDAANPKSYVSGSDVWNDLTSNGNSGSLVNGPTFSSANGGSIVFDGIDDYVGITNLTWTPSAFTICWFTRGLTATNFNQVIESSFPSVGGWGGFVFHTTSNGAVYCGIDIPTRFTPTDLPSGTYSINVYQYFTFTYSFSGVGSFYKNGVLLASKSMNSSNTWSGLYIGATNNTINGNVSQVSVYNRALSAQEVLQNYNATKGRFGL